MSGSQQALESATEDYFDALCDIEREFEIDHSEWVEQVRSWCGRATADGYHEYWLENEAHA